MSSPKEGDFEVISLQEMYKKITGEDAPWVMRVAGGGFYTVTPSDQCKPEDHGKLNDHINSIEDVSGNVLWSRLN